MADKRMVGVRVDDETYEKLQRLAKAEKRPVGSLARNLIEEALEDRALVKESESVPRVPA